MLTTVFLGYKTIEPSYKTGSRSLGLFQRGKTCIIAKFQRTYLDICNHLREGRTASYSQGPLQPGPGCSKHCKLNKLVKRLAH